MNDIASKLSTLIETIRSINPTEVLEYFADKSIPLEERWNLFRAVPDVLVINKYYYQDSKVLEEAFNREISWYDDFYLERYETMNNVELAESRIWSNDHLNRYFKVYPEKINELKEEILASGIRTWRMDW